MGPPGSGKSTPYGHPRRQAAQHRRPALATPQASAPSRVVSLVLPGQQHPGSPAAETRFHDLHGPRATCSLPRLALNSGLPALGVERRAPLRQHRRGCPCRHRERQPPPVTSLRHGLQLFTGSCEPGRARRSERHGGDRKQSRGSRSPAASRKRSLALSFFAEASDTDTAYIVHRRTTRPERQRTTRNPRRSRGLPTIGAGGFEPPSSPTRITRAAPAPPGMCGFLRAIWGDGHTNRLCDQSARPAQGRPSAERPSPRRTRPPARGSPRPEQPADHARGRPFRRGPVVRAPLPHAGARACATSRTTTAVGRKRSASRASP
jgi:hypothetical protein